MPTPDRITPPLTRADGTPYWSDAAAKPSRAIGFALDELSKTTDAVKFLKAWRDGDVSEWPEFFTYLEPKEPEE